MRILLLIILIVTVGCNKEVKVVEEGSDVVAVESLKNSKVDCDENFDTFFVKFQNDSVFQKNHVKFPLKNTFLGMII